MDRSNNRRLFGMLRSERKAKTRAAQKSPAVIPGIAESIPTSSTHPSSTSSPPASHTSKVIETLDGVPQALEATDTRDEETLPSSSNFVPALVATSSAPSIGAHRLDDASDRERTEKRYRKAVEQLQKSIKLPRKNWEAFAIPDFKDFADVTNPIPQLQDDIKKTLDARAESFKDPGLWSTTKRVTEKIFTAITPLAKNVLLVAKAGSNVYAFFVAH
jgi:hypothetical protein